MGKGSPCPLPTGPSCCGQGIGGAPQTAPGAARSRVYGSHSPACRAHRRLRKPPAMPAIPVMPGARGMQSRGLSGPANLRRGGSGHCLSLGCFLGGGPPGGTSRWHRGDGQIFLGLKSLILHPADFFGWGLWAGSRVTPTPEMHGNVCVHLCCSGERPTASVRRRKRFLSKPGAEPGSQGPDFPRALPQWG